MDVQPSRCHLAIRVDSIPPPTNAEETFGAPSASKTLWLLGVMLWPLLLDTTGKWEEEEHVLIPMVMKHLGPVHDLGATTGAYQLVSCAMQITTADKMLATVMGFGKALAETSPNLRHPRSMEIDTLAPQEVSTHVDSAVFSLCCLGSLLFRSGNLSKCQCLRSWCIFQVLCTPEVSLI